MNVTVMVTLIQMPLVIATPQLENVSNVFSTHMAHDVNDAYLVTMEMPSLFLKAIANHAVVIILVLILLLKKLDPLMTLLSLVNLMASVDVNHMWMAARATDVPMDTTILLLTMAVNLAIVTSSVQSTEHVTL